MIDMSNRTYIKFYFWLVLFLIRISKVRTNFKIFYISQFPFCAYQYWHEASCAQMWPYSEWHWHRHGINIDSCMIKGPLHVVLWIGGLGKRLSERKTKQLSMRPFLNFCFPVFHPFIEEGWSWLPNIDCGGPKRWLVVSQAGREGYSIRLVGKEDKNWMFISREELSAPRKTVRS